MKPLIFLAILGAMAGCGAESRINDPFRGCQVGQACVSWELTIGGSFEPQPIDLVVYEIARTCGDYTEVVERDTLDGAYVPAIWAHSLWECRGGQYLMMFATIIRKDRVIGRGAALTPLIKGTAWVEQRLDAEPP